MTKFATSIVKILLFCLVYGALSITSARAEQVNFTIRSTLLNETREIIVHLPEHYDPNAKDGYPVIYMLDGGNDDELTAQAVRAHHAAKIMPEVIVVAIPNIRRGFDFTPPYITLDQDGKNTPGNGDKFLAFIKNEMIPQTNKNFRTNGHKLFMGHSWGGAFAAYIISQSPELFDGFFLYSPALGRKTDETYAHLKATFKKDHNLPKFIYVSVGDSEREGFKRSFNSLTALLKQHLPPSVKLHLERNAGAAHMENPEISIPKALKIYFSRTN